jgi:tRNA/rRNA methyltransferase
MLGERPPLQPKKAEAYVQARRDKGAPAVILVQPFLDENVGSAARAMLNFGLWDLRLVTPECDFLSHMARVRASGADEVLERARVFPDVGSAVADLSGVVATTARQRDMTIEVVTPEEAARRVVGCVAPPSLPRKPLGMHA